MSAAISQDPDETPAPTPTAPSEPTALVTHPQAQSPKGLLTRARKARAEQMPLPPPPIASTSVSARLSTSASAPTVITESTGPSTMPYRLRKKTLSAAIVDSDDDNAATGDVAEQAKEMPPGFVIPVVNVQHPSPDKDKEKKALPFAMGEVCF